MHSSDVTYDTVLLYGMTQRAGWWQYRTLPGTQFHVVISVSDGLNDCLVDTLVPLFLGTGEVLIV